MSALPPAGTAGIEGLTADSGAAQMGVRIGDELWLIDVADVTEIIAPPAAASCAVYPDVVRRSFRASRQRGGRGRLRGIHGQAPHRCERTQPSVACRTEVRHQQRTPVRAGDRSAESGTLHSRTAGGDAAKLGGKHLSRYRVPGVAFARHARAHGTSKLPCDRGVVMRRTASSHRVSPTDLRPDCAPDAAS